METKIAENKPLCDAGKLSVLPAKTVIGKGTQHEYLLETKFIKEIQKHEIISNSKILIGRLMKISKGKKKKL